VPQRELAAALKAADRMPHLIGGALHAGERRARRAIDQAARLAALL
jgi:2,4-dienoyl-CoA reductase (NADPH2)